MRGVTLREDPPSVTSLTPEMEPGVDAPDLLPRRVFFFFFPPPKPPFGITLARRTAPAAPSASAASDARVDALVRLVLTGPDVRLAFSLERGLGLGGVQAFLLLGGGGSLLGRLGVANFPLPAHLLLSLGLDRGSLGLLRRFGLVRGGFLPRLLLRLLRRGGSLGVGL